MSRGLNTLIGLAALVALLVVVFKNPKTNEQLANTYDSVADSLQNSYVLYFEPTKKTTTEKEAEELKKHLESLTDSYKKYIEKDLGSTVKHHYDTAVNGLSIQLLDLPKVLKALGQKATKKGKQQHEIAVDKLYELFYTLKGDDLRKWGVQLKLEKDKRIGV